MAIGRDARRSNSDRSCAVRNCTGKSCYASSSVDGSCSVYGIGYSYDAADNILVAIARDRSLFLLRFVNTSLGSLLFGLLCTQLLKKTATDRYGDLVPGADISPST